MNDELLAPIVLFVFNRPEHTRKTVEALKNNFLAEKSELYIIADGPKKLQDPTQQTEHEKSIEATRNCIKNTAGFKKITIIEKEVNSGLAVSIIEGVTDIIERYGKIIVLEDDIITARGFLKYMNETLSYYRDFKDIFSISGYIFPYKKPSNYEFDTFIYPRNSTWGWGTWKDRWEKADWEVKTFNHFIKDKKSRKKFNRGGDDLTNMLQCQMNGSINSWGIRWCYTQFENEAYGLFPTRSLVQNIGFDGSGIHCEVSTWNDVEMNNDQFDFNLLDEVIENPDMIKQVSNFFKKSIKSKIRHFVKKILKSVMKDF